MKLFFATVLLSLSARAFTTGEFHCTSGDDNNSLSITYKIKSLNVNNVELPYLDISKTYHKNPADPGSKDIVYVVQGIATRFLSSNGKEQLALAGSIIELTEGKPSCTK